MWFVVFCTAEPGLTRWLLQALFLSEKCSQKAVWPPSVDPVFTARLGVTGRARLGAASPAADDKSSLAAPRKGKKSLNGAPVAFKGPVHSFPASTGYEMESKTRSLDKALLSFHELTLSVSEVHHESAS